MDDGEWLTPIFVKDRMRNRFLKSKFSIFRISFSKFLWVHSLLSFLSGSYKKTINQCRK